MDRQPPQSTSDEIDLYIRTYYSLLRSSGEVRVRAFEEPHAFSGSSLHAGALESIPDVGAFGYAAARLPEIMPRIRRIVLGQSHEQFETAGFDVRAWPRVRTRGRRRPLRDGGDILAAFITSASDIDDIVPIVTAYQIEWNKIHAALSQSTVGRRLVDGATIADEDLLEVGRVLDLDAGGVATIRAALGKAWEDGLRAMASRPCDLFIMLLNGSFNEYQRAAHRWWSGIEPTYLRPGPERRRRPVYFVSSNTHSLVNLLGGYARRHRESIFEFARRRNPEGLAPRLEEAIAAGDEAEISQLTYYLLRSWLRDPELSRGLALDDVRRYDADGGIEIFETPGHIDVDAQVIELGRIDPSRLDPRVKVDGLDALAKSDAVIINIDYPLGLSAYHHLTRIAHGVGELRGIYVMGKAATLNARVGDILIPTVVHDEHSRNTYLYRNCFAARDLQPWLRFGSVFDTQKALTVRGPFLQNRDYMGVFYREGYTILEMEAGPYLSAIFEIVSPRRHPDNEIVHLSNTTPFDVGILHYASDTPYSRRQSLLSKSLSYFGMDATYACAVAILRRILEREILRQRI